MQAQNFKLALVCILVIAILMVKQFPIEGALFLDYTLMALLVIAMGSLSRESAIAKSQAKQKREKNFLTRMISRNRYTTQ